MLAAFLIAVGVPASAPAAAVEPTDASVAAAISRTLQRPTGSSDECKSEVSAEVVVCGRAKNLYRIDPSVMEATRAREALPPEGDPRTDTALAGSACVGPNACQGDFVPLVAVGLTALKAAALAAQGDDWREAFRTREDEYRLYKQAEAKKARERRPKIGIALSK